MVATLTVEWGTIHYCLDPGPFLGRSVSLYLTSFKDPSLPWVVRHFLWSGSRRVPAAIKMQRVFSFSVFQATVSLDLWPGCGRLYHTSPSNIGHFSSSTWRSIHAFPLVVSLPLSRPGLSGKPFFFFICSQSFCEYFAESCKEEPLNGCKSYLCLQQLGVLYSHACSHLTSSNFSFKFWPKSYLSTCKEDPSSIFDLLCGSGHMACVSLKELVISLTSG